MHSRIDRCNRYLTYGAVATSRERSAEVGSLRNGHWGSRRSDENARRVPASNESVRYAAARSKVSPFSKRQFIVISRVEYVPMIEDRWAILQVWTKRSAQPRDVG